MKSKLLFLLFIIIIILLRYCVPPPSEITDEEQVMSEEERARQDSIKDMKCKLYLSFAYSYYQNQDWKSAIKNYSNMLSLGCEDKYAEDIFPYLGRCYQMLAQENKAYLDSALDVYIKGEEYLPKNMFIHKNLAYIYHLKGNIDLEIREYEKMVEIEPRNIELLQTLSKLYFKAERYRDVLWACDQILKINPNNKQAINDKLLANKKLGRDVLDVLKEQWINNKTDVATGIEYAKALVDRLDYDEAEAVLKEVTQANLRNREAWEYLAKLYASIGKYEDASNTYEYIIKNIAPRDISIYYELVKSYIQTLKFREAYRWANRARQINRESSLVYRMFGDIYYATAEYYANKEKLSFEDKLVYKLSYDKYKIAYQKGEIDVKSRLDYLAQYLIPTEEDWFLNRYDSKGNMRRSFKPLGENYSWIEEEPSKEK